jgi:hypothetical protein
MNELFKKIQCWVSDLAGSNGKAIHAHDGKDHHAVAIESMKVIIVKDSENSWFAQSIDIDYASSGNSLEEVQKNFEIGLSATIAAHLRRFGNLDRIMRTPKMDNWRHLVSSEHGAYDVTIVSIHKDEKHDGLDSLPFKNISFYQEKLAA